MHTRPGSTSWRARLLIAVAVLALLAAACGERSDDGDSGQATDDTAATDDGGGGEGDFGDLTGVCGPAEGGEPGPTGDDPAETQGITDDSIAVGTVSDPGFEGSPGLNQEIFDASEAFVDWCNEQGGINGRQIDLTLRDAAINNYQPVVEEACANDFALVGSGAVQDNLWVDVGQPCDLIDVAGFSVTPEKGGLAGRDPLEARTVQPLPNPADRQQVGAATILAEDFPDAVEGAYVMFADLATLITQADKEEQGFSQVGWDFQGEATYNILGETNWTPFANDIENAEATALRFVGEPGNLALLQLAFDEVGYEPEVVLQGANFYDQKYLDEAGASAEGTYVETVFHPLEEADDNPATAKFLELMEEQGGKVALLGAQSMSGWLLFATSARDCDLEGNLTRTCILEKTAEVTEWTGGGLHAPTSPGTNEPSTCQIALVVEGDAFTRYAPDEGFACDPAYVVEVDPGSSG